MPEIKDDNLGLWEYTYLLDSGVVYKFAITRGEELPECDCGRDHSDAYTRYECNVHVQRVSAEHGTQEVYHGCPEMYMPYECNELLIASGILGIGEILNESCRALVMQRMIKRMMGGILNGDQAVVMPVNRSTGKALELLPVDTIRFLEPLGREMFEVLEQARVNGNRDIPVDVMERVFGFTEAPQLEYDPHISELVKELLDNDE